MCTCGSEGADEMFAVVSVLDASILLESGTSSGRARRKSDLVNLSDLVNITLSLNT